MPVLILTHADLKPLCAIGAADTSEDSDLDALIVAQQPVLEYAIDPAILAAASANAGLQATLTLGLAETLAGEFLRRQARAPGFTDDFHLGSLVVNASRTDNLAQLGERLAAQGAKRLEPFGRAMKRLAYDAAGGTPDGSARSPLLAAMPTGASVFDLPLFDLPCEEVP